MRRELFLHLIDSVCATDPWFIQKRDASGRLGLSSLHRCIVGLQMLAYGLLANVCDEYVCIGETIALVAMKHWIMSFVIFLEISTCNSPHVLICNDKLRLI